MFDLIRSIQTRDPDAKPGLFHVLLSSNGLHAVLLHRVSHWLWSHHLKILGQMVSGFTRFLTGIEIHPQAQIGARLFIDHGTGVVIGQTAVIGDNVTIYHGVTLGGKGGSNEPFKRHPTIEDDVIIGAGAQILGNITIGAEAKVGANAVVTGNVPAGCTVVGNPARLVHCKDDEGKAYGLPRHLVDPVAEAIDGLLKDVKELKKKAGIIEEEPEEYEDHWKGGGI